MAVMKRFRYCGRDKTSVLFSSGTDTDTGADTDTDTLINGIVSSVPVVL
jgi:hypothetical protein